MRKMTEEQTITHFHLFCGIGGAARGGRHLSITASSAAGPLRGTFRCLGGIDVDPGAVKAFSSYTGAPGTCRDLFSRDQYLAFHGREPGAGWIEAVPDDLRRAAGGESPDILVTSPPCKGFSGLVSEARAASGKYSALNRLTIRGIDLALRAWENDPPRFWLLENVPRLANRGEHLLAEMVGRLEAAGYSCTWTVPDLGELGGLGQSRKRLHLVARHRDRVPVFVFEPPRRPLRSVGDIIGPLPLPEHPAGGVLHRLPKLTGKTWVRLALIPAGGDWRDLQGLVVEDGYLRDFAIAPETEWYRTALGVLDWQRPAGTVTSEGRPQNGAFATADPRVPGEWNQGVLGVNAWDATVPTVTGTGGVTNGRYGLQDPRVPGAWGTYGQYGIMRWQEPAPCVTANDGPGGGPNSIPDPRLGWARVDGDHYTTGRHYGVTDWNATSGAVTAAGQYDNGPWSIGDPRVDGVRHNNVYRIVRWDGPSVAITAGQTPTSGGVAIGDPRLPSDKPGKHFNQDRVSRWTGPAHCVTGATRTGSGAPSIADPRGPAPACLTDERGLLVIRALDGTWHRPMTVLERAALQGLVSCEELDDFTAAVAGQSLSRVSEWVGNAIPPPSMAATLEAAGIAILLARAVRPVESPGLGQAVRPRDGDRREDRVMRQPLDGRQR